MNRQSNGLDARAIEVDVTVSGANTAVSVNVPAFGLGNTGATINLYGYRIPG